MSFGKLVNQQSSNFCVLYEHRAAGSPHAVTILIPYPHRHLMYRDKKNRIRNNNKIYIYNKNKNKEKIIFKEK